MMWYINLINEFTDCINLADFIWNFPVKNVFPFFPNRVVNMVNNIPQVKRRRTGTESESNPEEPDLSRPTSPAHLDADFSTRTLTHLADLSRPTSPAHLDADFSTRTL